MQTALAAATLALAAGTAAGQALSFDLAPLDVPQGADSAFLADLNLFGEVVGTAMFGTDLRAVHWDAAGQASLLAHPNDAPSDLAFALGINNDGAIVGSADVGGERKPLLWTDPAAPPATLVVPGTGQGRAFDINDYGRIVGYDIVPVSGEDFIRGYVWDADAPDAAPLRLGGLAGGGAPPTSTLPTAVNEAGDVAGDVVGRLTPDGPLLFRVALWDASAGDGDPPTFLNDGVGGDPLGTPLYTLDIDGNRNVAAVDGSDGRIYLFAGDGSPLDLAPLLPADVAPVDLSPDLLNAGFTEFGAAALTVTRDDGETDGMFSFDPFGGAEFVPLDSLLAPDATAAGWDVTSISAVDGLLTLSLTGVVRVAGYATNPAFNAGQPVPVLLTAVIPEPAAASLLPAVCLLLRRRGRGT